MKENVITMRRTTIIASMFVIVAVLALTHHLGAQTTTPRTKYFCGLGKVISVDEDKSGVKISHHAIEGYMPAMTMHFKTENGDVIGDVKAGDTVRFTLKDTPELTRLIYIEKIAPERQRQKRRGRSR